MIFTEIEAKRRIMGELSEIHKKKFDHKTTTENTLTIFFSFFPRKRFENECFFNEFEFWKEVGERWGLMTNKNDNVIITPLSREENYYTNGDVHFSIDIKGTLNWVEPPQLVYGFKGIIQLAFFYLEKVGNFDIFSLYPSKTTNFVEKNTNLESLTQLLKPIFWNYIRMIPQKEKKEEAVIKAEIDKILQKISQQNP